MIRGLVDVTVHVSDLRRAAAFYGGLLNLRVLAEAPDGCVLDLGGTKLHLRGGGRARAADPRGGVVLALAVRDVFSVVEHLRSEGVTFFGGIQHENGSNTATFADPDGNVFRLQQAG